MNYTAVVAGLVTRNALFFFKQRNARSRMPLQQRACGGKADDASADHDEVEVVVAHACVTCRIRRAILS